jgi:hypothetical protein
MKKANKSNMNWGVLIVLIMLITIIEIIGCYCSNHAEDHRQKEWDKFEKRMQEVHYMTKW